jgi:hypothetical protein
MRAEQTAWSVTDDDDDDNDGDDDDDDNERMYNASKLLWIQMLHGTITNCY